MVGILQWLLGRGEKEEFRVSYKCTPTAPAGNPTGPADNPTSLVVFNNLRKDLYNTLDSQTTKSENGYCPKKDDEPLFSTPFNPRPITRNARGGKGDSVLCTTPATLYTDYRRCSLNGSLSGRKKGRPRSSVGTREKVVYGGYGVKPGIMTTLAEVGRDEVECKQWYSVVSTYSTLRHGEWGCTPVSVLQPIKQRDSGTVPINMVFREMDVLAVLKHPFIVQLLGISTGPRDVFLLLEPLPGGTLYTSLHVHHASLTSSHVVQVAHNLCCALQYLHTRGFVHTGVSSHSVFLGREPKLGNLGYVQAAEAPVLYNTGNFWQWADVWITEERPSESSDIYSLGCVLWECLSGKIPWKNATRENVVLQICRGRKLARPKGSRHLVDFVMAILRKELKTTSGVVAHLKKLK